MNIDLHLNVYNNFIFALIPISEENLKFKFYIMNKLLKKELERLDSKIAPLLETEMALLLGGASVNDNPKDPKWCIIKVDDTCGIKNAIANRGEEEIKTISF